MNTMKYIVAHDFGTTALKAVLFTAEGALVRSVTVEYPTYRGEGNRAEQDPEDWWNAFCHANHALLDDEARKNVACVSFDGTYPNCLCVDASGNPLHRAMIWQDGRAVQEAAELTELFPKQRLHHVPGHRLSADRSLCKLRWVQKHQPEVFRQTAMMLPSVVSFILLRLTGRAVCDFDVGKGTAMMDQKRKTWAGEVLELANVPREILPELLHSKEVIGVVPQRLENTCGLAAGTNLVVGTCDNLCADIGAGMVRPGQGYLNLGTSANMAVLSQEGRRLGMATASTGSSLKWMIETIAAPELAKAEAEGGNVYEAVSVLIDQAPAGSHGVFFHPYLAGARSTLNNSGAKGSFTGLTLSADRKDLMRAVVEGIGMNLCLILNDLKERGNNITKLNVVGGMAKSRVFLQIFADIFGVELHRLSHGDSSAAIGAAVLGGIAVSLFENETAVERFLTVEEVIVPDPERHAFYAGRMALYRRIYDAQEPLYPALT
ncbi:MAG: hypothetical protein IJ206_04050 [Oscillospiraceae bacterium]|nr:hypothetical protein [Oscillospiraceae bacterium]